MKIAILAIDAREFHKDYQTPVPYFGNAVQALVHGLESLKDEEIHIVSCLQKPVAPFPKLAPNIHYHSLLVPKIGWGRTLYSGCIRASRRKLREINPDIVHGQGTERDCALAAALSGFPNIITIHGNMRTIAKAARAPLFSFLTFQSLIESWAIRRTGGVICLSTHAQRHAARAKKTWVIPNAVDESYFSVQRSSQPTRDILCIGTITRVKNQNFLIRALDPIASRADFRLVFLGSGVPGDPYLQEFEALVKERKWCAHEGFRKGNDLKNYLQSGLFLILPSLEENCPMVILESMAAGLPVAAARAGGIPDLIDHRVNGLLFDPQNEQSIREAVLELLKDGSNLAKPLAASGRHRADTQFRPAIIGQRHLEIYNRFLAARGN